MAMALKVNKDEWEGLPANERKQIEAIISGHFKGTRIVVDPSAPRFSPAGTGAITSGNVLCKVACTAAEAAAVAACALLVNPIAVAACIAAAHVAGDECRKQC